VLELVFDIEIPLIAMCTAAKLQKLMAKDEG
jgi:hypothetical protein